MIPTIFYFILALVVKKVITDNLPSFKISLRKPKVRFKLLRRKAIRYRIRHQYKFDYADYIFDRSFKSMLYSILLLSGMLITISFAIHSDNPLAAQVFLMKSGIIVFAIIVVSFLPAVSKPVKQDTLCAQ